MHAELSTRLYKENGLHFYFLSTASADQEMLTSTHSLSKTKQCVGENKRYSKLEINHVYKHMVIFISHAAFTM